MIFGQEDDVSVGLEHGPGGEFQRRSLSFVAHQPNVGVPVGHCLHALEVRVMNQHDVERGWLLLLGQGVQAAHGMADPANTDDSDSDAWGLLWRHPGSSME